MPPFSLSCDHLHNWATPPTTTPHTIRARTRQPRQLVLNATTSHVSVPPPPAPSPRAQCIACPERPPPYARFPPDLLSPIGTRESRTHPANVEANASPRPRLRYCASRSRVIRENNTHVPLSLRFAPGGAVCLIFFRVLPFPRSSPLEEREDNGGGSPQPAALRRRRARRRPRRIRPGVAASRVTTDTVLVIVAPTPPRAPLRAPPEWASPRSAVSSWPRG